MIPKFRAYYKLNRKMYKVLTLDIIDKKALIENTDDPERPLRGYEKLKNIVLMQTTGMKDKNGKEIYEWDIIKVCGFARWKGIAKYLPEKAAFVLWDLEKTKYRDDYVFLSQFDEGFEILGNIYDSLPDSIEELEEVMQRIAKAE